MIWNGDISDTVLYWIIGGCLLVLLVPVALPLARVPRRLLRQYTRRRAAQTNPL